MIDNSYAAPNDTYGVRYPHLSLITPYNGNVYFSGLWYMRLIIVQRNSNGQWSTYTCPGLHRDLPHLFAIDHRLIFMSSDRSMAFDLDTLHWNSIEEAEAIRLLKLSDEATPQKILTEKISLKEGNSLATYDFPLPSFNAYKRWRFNPSPGSGLEANIGDTIHLHNCIWFTIDFYAGEGSTGIGGLGIFDLKQKTFGVLRDPSLSSSSANHLYALGDTIFITTALRTEGGTIDASGLVIVDTHNGRIANINDSDLPLLGGSFSSIKLVGNYLWMLTGEAIVGWDLSRDSWCAVRMDSVITNAITPFSRRTYIPREPSEDFDSVCQDSLVFLTNIGKGIRLNLKWIDEVSLNWIGKAEFDGDTVLSGWVSKEDLREHQNYDKDLVAGYPGLRIFADSVLTIPYNYVKFGSITEKRIFGKVVNIQTNNLWCDVSFVDPIFSPLWENKHFVPQWKQYGGSFDSLKSKAFAEFRREQQEIKERIPIYDTSFTLSRDIDIYDKLHDLLDAHWLPSGQFTDPSPIGFYFKIDPSEASTEVKLLCEHGQIAINGNKYVPGTELLINTPTIKASFRFTDIKFADKEENTFSSIKVRYSLILLP
jgi:hypothetical protein